jgi:hypothetical protein
MIPTAPTSWLSSAVHPYDEPYIVRVEGLLQTFSQQTTADTPQNINKNNNNIISTSTFAVSSTSLIPASDHLNALLLELQKVCWLPNTFIALVVQHQLDMEGILDLTDANLRRQFFIDDSDVRNRVRSYFALCLRIFETQRDDEIQFGAHVQL